MKFFIKQRANFGEDIRTANYTKEPIRKQQSFFYFFDENTVEVTLENKAVHLLTVSC